MGTATSATVAAFFTPDVAVGFLIPDLDIPLAAVVVAPLPVAVFNEEVDPTGLRVGFREVVDWVFWRDEFEFWAGAANLLRSLATFV